MTLSFADFERVGAQKGSNRGGVYRHLPSGERYYLKKPRSERQGYNEVIASRFYDRMGFDAIDYHWVNNGMVASEWRYGLPERSYPGDLRQSATVLESFVPSALIANWDVIGLVYDNVLYDPETMSGPVFLDFGGTFDTRAMGGHKPFAPNEIPALDGFLDPDINESAHSVYRAMTPAAFRRSQKRIEEFRPADMENIMESVGFPEAPKRAEILRSRKHRLLELTYEDVFKT